MVTRLAAKPIETAGTSPALRICIIDDDAEVASTLERVLGVLGEHDVRKATAYDPSLLGGAWIPDVVFTDLIMPGFDGIEVIAQCRERAPSALVIVISGYSSLDNAVKAVKAGAFDFLPKPFTPDSVELVLAKAAREILERKAALDAARDRANQDPHLAALVGSSRAMGSLREWILKVRDVQANVLIEGETGTGKELVARAIHAGRGPFVAVNVASIPKDLAESEFFGHRAGAFTGAGQERSGLFAEADGGTLFLDEVNAMDLSLQAKLLRVIQERRFRPIGGTREVNVSFRLICAANEPLDELVAAGGLRRDLYHRINVVSYSLPSLKERTADIGELVAVFLQRFSRLHQRNLRRISPDALALLRARTWPGNVRELENLIEQAVIYSDPTETDFRVESLAFKDPVSGTKSSGETLTLSQMQGVYARLVMERTGGNKSEAARLLDIDYKTLLRHLQKEQQ